ncbi:nicotinamide riboside transporter PnuC [Aquabacterium sp. J223]|uniref:nicotinamide riboside transporter PnuC n=1 Tax=Aquabacterium sp. J223 TaxID=2898431 RepID=UPI0021ADA289|nr:nicotinamide riboside transporter PnuC [Aquabacterium sp. J223]UUX97609.1 nicotinamide riboside transporter PnuC [Aquabacterium sp. J223]
MTATASPLLQPLLTLGGVPVSAAEALAIVLALWMVGCNLRVHPLAWPLAMASSALYAWVFAAGRLYGQVALQAVFIAVAAWGWWQWRHGRQADGAPLAVRWLSWRGRLAVLAAVLVAWPLLGGLLQWATDHPSPWQDALPTAGGLAGQWLLGRQYVENWMAWVAVNALSIVLFLGQGLVATAGLYMVFLALAAVGWHRWARLAGGARPAAAAVA